MPTDELSVIPSHVRVTLQDTSVLIGVELVVFGTTLNWHDGADHDGVQLPVTLDEDQFSVTGSPGHMSARGVPANAVFTPKEKLLIKRKI